jgi:hypothetical protein
MDDQTLFFASLAPATPDRGHLLARMLRPFARQPNVFVADDDMVTRVTIHKDATVDIELAIDTTGKRWTATARDRVTGAELVQQSTATTERAALLGELRTFLDAVVEPPVRLMSHDAPRLETATAAGWQRIAPFC